MVILSKKYLLLYIVTLFVISGCIEFPQTQAEKIGWNQVKYEEYSAYYDVLQPYPIKPGYQYESDYNNVSKGLTLDEWLISIPKDKNEFEMTWYLAFYHIKMAKEMRFNLKCVESISNDPVEKMMNQRNCEYRLAQEAGAKKNATYLKAAEYRHKIENMKMNLSR